MTDFINNFHFLRPWFLLFLLLPLFLLFKHKSQDITTDSPWSKVCDKNLLEFLLVKKHNDTKKISPLLKNLILLILPLSLAGPCWQKTENPALSVNNPLIIALNMSSGMWSKDVSPSRAARAKFLIKDILNGVNSTETGMEVYSREPFMISPISEDKSLIDNLLPAITYDIMPVNGDRLDRAIDLAVERLSGAHYEDGNIIVLTYDIGERFDLALESASKAADAGYKVNVIDINSQQNSKLKMLADKGRGIYVGYNQNLEPLFATINNVGLNKFRQSENIQTVWQDNGWYLLFLPAVLLLYFFRRGIIIPSIIMILIATDADAGWFLNNNQEAMKAFEQGNYAEAAQKFENQQWKASAAYKNGDYTKAVQIYENFDDTENLYNYGNALAKSGKIKEAIEKYEQVLKQNPNHEDAKFNLEYLKKQQNQNQQQQQHNNQQNQQDKQNKKQQSAQNNQNSEQENSENSQSQQSEQSETEQQNAQNSENQNNENSEQSANTEQQNSDRENNKNKNDDKNTAEQPSQSENQPENGDKEQQVQALSSSDKSDDEKEREIRARQQKFREIKEDKGGLLRAFIRKEYNRKRYKE